MNSDSGHDGSSKIVPLRLSRKQIESNHDRLVQWVNGEMEFWDYKVDAAEFFPGIGNKLFDAIFERWEASLSVDPDSPPMHIVRKWGTAIPHLNSHQLGRLLAFYKKIADRSHLWPACTDEVQSRLQDLSESEFELGLEFVRSAASRFTEEERTECASRLLYLYGRYWRNPRNFEHAFALAWTILRDFDPKQFGEAIAAQGKSLGLPRPSTIRDHSLRAMDSGEQFSLPSELLPPYDGFWKAANQAHRRRKLLLRREKKLYGHFRRAMNVQGQAIERLLTESDKLTREGFSAASIVWSCSALEVFITKVLTRALLEGSGLDPGRTAQMIDDFFMRNSKHQMLSTMLEDYFHVKFPKGYWKDYQDLVALRNDIVHAGKRLDSRRAAERGIAAVRKLIKEIPKEIERSLQPNKHRLVMVETSQLLPGSSTQ